MLWQVPTIIAIVLVVSLRRTISTSIEKFIRYICTTPFFESIKVTNTQIETYKKRAHIELCRSNHIVNSAADSLK